MKNEWLFVLILIVFLSITGCKWQQEENVIPVSPELIDPYNFFRDSKKIYSYHNSDLKFGPPIDNIVVQTYLRFDTLTLKKMNRFIRPKGAFKLFKDQDTTLFFIYGLIDALDSTALEIRIRSTKGEMPVEDVRLIVFNSDLKYDYFADDYYGSESLIKVVAKNHEDHEHHSYFHCNSDGIIENQTIVPDTVFSQFPKHTYISGKRIRVFNDYSSRTLVDENRESANITGSIINTLGGKGLGFQMLVKLDANNLFKEDYVVIDNHACTHFNDRLAPCTMKLSKSGEVREAEGPFSKIWEVKGTTRLFKKKVYIEEI